MDKKTKAQYALAWIIPVILFSVLMQINVQPLLEIDPAHRFANDESYIGLAAANSYKEARVYGLSIYEAMPATRESLWHGAQIAVSWITSKAPQALLVLNFTFAVLAIGITSVLARRWCPGPFSTFAATLLFALLPLTMLGSLQGQPLALMLFLGAAACASHLRGIDGDTAPLTFRTALFVGLAAMVHVESILLWPIFALHAFLVLPFTKRKGVMPTAVFHFIMGLFILGVCLWPLIHWNVMTMHVPWPTSMDAALRLSTSTLDEVADISVQMHSVKMSALALLTKGFGAMTPLIFLGGIGLIAITIKSSRMRLLLPVLLFPILLSIGVSAMATLTGSGGVGQVILLFVPLMVALSVAGIAFIPTFCAQLKLPSKLTISGTARTVAILGLFVMAWQLTASAEKQRTELLTSLSDHQLERQAWQQQLSSYDGTQKIATDHPGWAAYQLEAEVIDLTGRCSWKLLSCLDTRGGIDPDMYAKFLSEAQPDLFVTWTEKGHEMARIMNEETSSNATEEQAVGNAAQWFTLQWP